jgi:2-keto-4-pentenoate hydratase
LVFLRPSGAGKDVQARVSARFTRDDAYPPLTAVLADDSGSGSVVCGPAIADWRTRDVAGQEVVLRVDGVARRRGIARRRSRSSAGSARQRAFLHVGMKAGELVSTGTLTGMVVARAGEEHVADYGPFGEIHVKFAQ